MSGMKPKCVARANAAAGRDLTESELSAISEKIRSSLKDLYSQNPEAFRAMTPSERHNAASEMAKQRVLQDAEFKRDAFVLDLRKKANLTEQIASVKPGKRGQTHQMGRLLDDAMTRDKPALSRYALRDLDATLKKNHKALGLLHDPASTLDIARAFFGEADASPEAQAIAKAGNAANKFMLDMAHAEGIPIHELPNYGMSQALDPYRVFKDSPEAFAEFMKQHVDQEFFIKDDGTFMDDAEVTSLLRNVQENVGLDGLGRSRGKSGEFTVGAGKNMPRHIRYKNADSYLAAMERYGKNANAYELIASHVDALAKDVAIAKAFGSKPDATFKTILEKATKADIEAAPGSRNTLMGDRAKVERAYQHTVHPDSPGNERAAQAISQTLLFTGSVKLQNMPVNLIPDIGIMAAASQLNGISPFRAFRQFASNLAKSNNAEFQGWLRREGIFNDALQAEIHKLTSRDAASHLGSLVSELTHRVSLQGVVDRALQSANGMLAMDEVGRLTRAHGTLAEAAEASYLAKRAGLTDAVWEVWKAADFAEAKYGETMITPSQLEKIPDAKLDKIVLAELERRAGKPVEATEGVLQEEREKLRNSAILELLGVAAGNQQFAGRGAAHSAPSDVVALGMDRTKDFGTVSGTFRQAFAQFKSVPVGIFRSQMDAAMDLPSMRLSDIQEGNWGAVWNSRQVHLARLAGYATVAGAMAVEINALQNGQDPRSMNIATDEGRKFWMESFIKGGSWGPYAEVMFHESNAWGQGALDTFMGPAYGTVGQVAREMWAAREAVSDEDAPEHNFGLAATRILRSNAVPLSNMWYTKAAFNRIVFDQLQEYLSPGVTARRLQSQEKKGVSYYWEPGTPAPQRAPELGAAFAEE